jgi:hypothetical protein
MGGGARSASRQEKVGIDLTAGPSATLMGGGVEELCCQGSDGDLDAEELCVPARWSGAEQSWSSRLPLPRR